MLKYLIKNDFDYTSKDNENLSPLDLSLKQKSYKNYNILNKYHSNNSPLKTKKEFQIEEKIVFEKPYSFFNKSKYSKWSLWRIYVLFYSINS